MRYLNIGIIIIFFFISMLFLFQNYESLSTSMNLKFDLILGPKYESSPLPFYALVLASFAIGALITLLYFSLEKVRLSAKLKSCSKKLAKLEEELNSLRNMPLNDAPSVSSAPATADDEEKNEESESSY